jgi:hypothetical protein
MEMELLTNAFTFDPDHEGDRAGRELATWIQEKLKRRDYNCEEIIQEDYGWGFYVTYQNVKIWVMVGIMDEQVNDMTRWGIFAEHDEPFNPLQWFKGKTGKEVVNKILSEISEIVEGESGMSIAEVN